MTFVVSIFLMVFITAGQVPGIECFEWYDYPRTIRALSGTTADFPWRYRADSDVDITWSYLGTAEQPRRRTIMFKTSNGCVTNLQIGPRLTCDIGPGEAIMRLGNVTEADEGLYEVKVNRFNMDTKRGEYIEGRILLSVLKDTDFRYRITVDGEVYQGQGVERQERGSEVVLSPSKVIAPRRLNITVHVLDPNTPTPHIRITKVIGNDFRQDEPICDGHFCHRYVGFCSDDVVSGMDSASGHVIIHIEFDVQNLEIPQHIINVTVEPKQAPSLRIVPSMEVNPRGPSESNPQRGPSRMQHARPSTRKPEPTFRPTYPPTTASIGKHDRRITFLDDERVTSGARGGMTTHPAPPTGTRTGQYSPRVHAVDDALEDSTAAIVPKTAESARGGNVDYLDDSFRAVTVRPAFVPPRDDVSQPAIIDSSRHFNRNASRLSNLNLDELFPGNSPLHNKRRSK